MAVVNDFFWITDAQGNAVESVTWRDFTGQSLEEIKGLGWTEALHPDDRELVRKIWQRAVGEQVPYETNYRLRGRDGQYRTFLARGVPVWDETGSIRQWVGFCTDITARTQSATAGIRAAEQLRYSLLAINACLDLNSALACLLQESLKLGGMDAGAVYLLEGQEAVLRHQINLPAAFVSQITRRPLTLEYIREVLQNPGEVLNITKTFPEHLLATQINGLRHVYSLALVTQKGPIGFLKLVSQSSHPPGASAIEMIRILVLETESTFQRLAAMDRLELVLKTMAEGVVVHGADGRITECNPSAEQILGLSRDEILGRIPMDPRWRTVHADGSDFPVVEHPALATLRTGCPVRDVTMGVWQPDGRLKWININTQPMMVLGENGPRGVVVSFSDVTRRRQLEEGFRQSQKMEGIGQLAGGVAHEFNNILAALMMNLELTRELTAETEALGRLGEMSELTHRAAELVRQLLAFSRQSVAKFEPFDLAVETPRQLKMLKPLLGENIEVEFHSSATRSWVNADKKLITQVIMNLCLNSRDAMKKGGRLKVRLTNEEPSLSRRETGEPGRREPPVCLCFADTGAGMDAAILARVFEPFFTTKGVGQGTGLGLATAQGIVEQHGGQITAESEAGCGSSFRVYLPTQTPPALAPVNLTANAPDEPATILVVDDEAAIRIMTRLFLTRAGFKVLEAASGREALEVWHLRQAEIKLIYTDIMMPGDLSGVQLMDRILVERPGMKAIITSGYTPDLADLEKVAAANLVYLPKPCPPATVLEIIRNCLLGSAPGNA